MANVRLVVEVDSASGELKLRKLGDGFEDVAKKAAGAKASTTAFSTSLKGEIRDSATGMASSLGPLGNLMVALGPAGMAGAAGLGLLTAGVVRGVRAQDEALAAVDRLNLALANQGNYSAAVSSKLVQQAEALQRVTRYDDEATNAAQGVLATFGMVGDEIERAIPKVLDYAAATGKDLPAAAETFGKAFVGNTKELTKQGFVFEGAKTAAEKYQLTLEQMGRYAGRAELDGASIAGSFTRISNAAADAEEGVGKFVLYLAGGDAKAGADNIISALGGIKAFFAEDLARALTEAKAQFLEWQASVAESLSRFLQKIAGFIPEAGSLLGTIADQAVPGLTKLNGLLLSGVPALEAEAAAAQKAANEMRRLGEAAIYQSPKGPENQKGGRNQADLDAEKAAQEALNQAIKDQMALNDFLGDDMAKLAKDEADYDKRNQEFIDERGKKAIEAFEAEMDRRKQLRSDSIDAYALQTKIDDAAKKARDEAAKKQEEIARQAREDMADAFMSVSMALGVIDSQLAKVLSRTAAFGAEVARIDWKKATPTDLIGIGAKSFSFGYEGMKALSGDEAREEARMAAQQATLDAAAAANEATMAAARAEEERQRQIEQTRGQIEQLASQMDAFKLKQIDEGVSGVDSMFASLGNGADVTQERLDRMSRTALALFNAKLKEGGDYMAALESLGPTLDDASAAAEKSGLALGGAFGDLAALRAKVEANKELVAGVQGWGQAMEAQRVSGMSLQGFNDGMAEANAYMDDLLAKGFSGEQALRQMAPGLLQLREAAKAHGWQIDEGTQQLIDQAESMGAFEGLTDPMQELVEISNKMLEAFYLIAETLGAELTPEMEKFRDKAQQAAKEVGGVGAGLGLAGGGGGIMGTLDGGTASAPILMGALPSFASGSGGYRDFGAGTPAMLHGVEKVTPRGQADAPNVQFGDFHIHLEGGGDDLSYRVRNGFLPAFKEMLREAVKEVVG